MRILFVSKRQYTGHDALDDKYGRLYEIPRSLAELGHTVEVALTSYRPRGDLIDEPREGVGWSSSDVWPLPHRPFLRWGAVIKRFAPDVLVASSDSAHLVVGELVGSHFGLPTVLDFYDDYEAFGLSRLPGLSSALRRASRRATSLVTVTRTLRAHLVERGASAERVSVIENGIPDGFVPALGKAAARAALGLPLDVPLVGTAGSLTSARGIQDLIDAHALLLNKRPEVRLCLAGVRDRSLRRISNKACIDLGVLPHRDVALLWKALDVGVVCNREGAFSRSCHPMKLVEMAACGLPVIATELGEVSSILGARPDALYPPGDSAMLADRMLAALRKPTPLDAGISQSWRSIARQYEAVLTRAVGQHPNGPTSSRP